MSPARPGSDTHRCSLGGGLGNAKNASLPPPKKTKQSEDSLTQVCSNPGRSNNRSGFHVEAFVKAAGVEN